MKLLMLSVALFAAAAAAKKNGSKEASASPDATLAKAYGGRVWAAESAPPAGSDELRAWLAAHHAGGELARKAKDGPWTVAYVAVFKRPAAKGPVTLKFFDKKDQMILVEESSSENDAATVVYHGSYELDPDHGFNKGHTYVVKVGQIIKGKFQPYASGEVTLK
jgi:hypothetical protein